MGEVNCLQVAFYIPNLIGYTRFFFLAITPLFIFYETLYPVSFACYIISYVLDGFDGAAARKFKQESRFGAALDQICDRASNSMIYMCSSIIFPKQSFIFFIWFLLDFGSHWL